MIDHARHKVFVDKSRLINYATIWSSGSRTRLIFQGSWVRFPALYTVWALFTFICCKNLNVCLKKTKNKTKRGRGRPILEINYATTMVNCTLISCRCQTKRQR